MQINPEIGARIRKIVQSDDWSAIKKIAEDYCENIKLTPKITTSQWSMIKDVLMKEGKIDGVKDFIRTLFDIGK